MISITQMEYAIALNKYKHFGRAAIACNVTQPTLSEQIQKMESFLDVVLFDRSKKPIITTATGIEIIQQCEKTLQEHKKIKTIAQESSNKVQGEFHLAVIPTVSTYLLPLFVKKFSKDFPNVNLKISEYKTDEIIDKLLKDELDGALLVTPLKNNKIIERHLYYEPFFGFVGTEHPLHKNKTISEEDLIQDNLWLLEEGHCFRNQVLKVCSIKRNNTLLKNIQFNSGNFETLKGLVKNGNGYTLLPQLALSNLTKADKEVYLKKFKNPVPTREVSLICSRSFLKESILHAIEKTIIENLPKEINSLKKENINIIDVDIPKRSS